LNVQAFVAPLFLEDAQFSSTLYVVNEANSAVAGKLLLLSPEGHLILAKIVTVPGHDRVEVPVKSLLDSVSSNATRGSLELFDDNTYGSALAGEVVITFHGESSSVNIDEELLIPTMSQSHELRGIAVEAVASPVISISSTSDQPVQVGVKCIRERGKPTQTSFQIRSHEIVTLRPCSDLPGPIDAANAFRFAAGDLGHAEAKGIQIVSSDPKAEIQAFGFSPTLTEGTLSFAPIPFQDPGDVLSSEAVYPGVPVGYTGELWGTYQPRVSVQNYSSEARTITVYNARTRWGGSTFSEVASFVVGPSSVATVAIENQAGSPDALNTYVVRSDGQPADVHTQLWSEDGTRHSRVLFAGKDSRDDRNTGMHPWTLQDGASDELYLYNETEADQRVNLKVNNRVKLWRKFLVLQPHETRKISIRSLVDQGLNDDSNSPFSLGAGEGEISWYTTTIASVRGRLEHKDGRRHLVTSFQCAGYTVFCGIYPISGPSSLAIGQTAQFSSYDAIACVNNEAANQCYGVESGSYANPSYQWSSTGGITFSGPTDYAYVNGTGSSVGSSTLFVEADNAYCYFTESQAVNVPNPGTVNSADVTTDKISVTLNTAGSGELTVALVSGSGSTSVYQGNASSGTANYSFNLSSLPAQEFTSVQATWTVNGVEYTGSLSYHIRVNGMTTLTQYNTPHENQCSGSPQADTVYNNSCAVTNTSLVSGFIFRVTNLAGGTGSAVSGHGEDLLT
jgi:hypothetical protein